MVPVGGLGGIGHSEASRLHILMAAAPETQPAQDPCCLLAIGDWVVPYPDAITQVSTPARFEDEFTP